MRRFVIAAIAVWGLAACGNSVMKSVEGTVLDASMNTVIIVSGQGDTLMFSTIDADKSEVNGLLLGSPISVEYAGKLSGVTSATKISTCRTYSEAVGRWIMEDPLDTSDVMGVELQVGGVAQSINMATLLYTSWELTEESGTIILSGQSVGNGQTIGFSEKAVIAKDADERWTLTVGNMVYFKENQSI